MNVSQPPFSLAALRDQLSLRSVTSVMVMPKVMIMMLNADDDGDDDCDDNDDAEC